MTEADLIKDCREFEAEHGILKLLSILEDIIECQAQAAGVAILDDDELDDMECIFATLQ